MILGQKRSCSSINHLGLFLPFPARPWISASSVTSQSAPSHCENWHEDETATDSKVKTNAPFSPTKHVY